MEHHELWLLLGLLRAGIASVGAGIEYCYIDENLFYLLSSSIVSLAVSFFFEIYYKQSEALLYILRCMCVVRLEKKRSSI